MVAARLPLLPQALLAAAAVALAVAAASCGGGSGPDAATLTPVSPEGGTLTVRAFEWGYEPAAIALLQGEQVRIEFENDGTVLHNIAIEGLDAEVIESKSTGPLSGDEGELFAGAEAGQNGLLTFVPLEAGSYTFFCTVQGHRDLGMEGTLTVEPP
jgi:uncharacterized cupredoxin-like copper-binding protein